jgi:hypothetical protein
MVRAGLGYSMCPHGGGAGGGSLRINGTFAGAALYRQLAVVMRQDKIVTKGMAEMLRLLHAVR